MIKEYWLLHMFGSLFIYNIANWPDDEKRLVRLAHDHYLSDNLLRFDDDYWEGCRDLDALCSKMWKEEVEGQRPTVYDTFHAKGDKGPIHLDGILYTFTVNSFLSGETELGYPEREDQPEETPVINTMLWVSRQKGWNPN
jgi:hypothetical protein